MAGSVNKVILVGSVGRDPEVRTFQSGDRVVSFSLATTESWRDKNTGERKERTEWHNIQVFNENIGKVAEQYLRKGSKVYLEGTLQTREYTDKDGNQRKVTEVVLPRFRGELVLLDSRAAGHSEPEAPRPSTPSRPGSMKDQYQDDMTRSHNPLDDDIPFAPEWR